jgi:predicted transcriptional regulator of viral defense system
MTTLEVLSLLNRIQVPLVQTKDIADILHISTHSAGKYLETLRAKNFIEKISRGKWVVKDANFDPLQVAEFITAPKESYLSLHTALFYHGMIDQVPARIYSVTIDRSRVVKTPVGIYSFHHCNPDFFTGYQYVKPYLKMASPEKALVDYFYFSPSKSRQFNKLPEINIPARFSSKRALRYCEKITSRRTKSLVEAKLRSLLMKF